MARVQGAVKWFNESKGFGFITLTDGRDVFAHYSQIQQPGFKKITEGETVEFDLCEGPKGLYAEKITEL